MRKRDNSECKSDSDCLSDICIDNICVSRESSGIDGINSNKQVQNTYSVETKKDHLSDNNLSKKDDLFDFFKRIYENVFKNSNTDVFKKHSYTIFNRVLNGFLDTLNIEQKFYETKISQYLVILSVAPIYKNLLYGTKDSLEHLLLCFIFIVNEFVLPNKTRNNKLDEKLENIKYYTLLQFLKDDKYLETLTANEKNILLYCRLKYPQILDIVSDEFQDMMKESEKFNIKLNSSIYYYCEKYSKDQSYKGKYMMDLENFIFKSYSSYAYNKFFYTNKKDKPYKMLYSIVVDNEGSNNCNKVISKQSSIILENIIEKFIYEIKNSNKKTNNFLYSYEPLAIIYTSGTAHAVYLLLEYIVDSKELTVCFYEPNGTITYDSNVFLIHSIIQGFQNSVDFLEKNSYDFEKIFLLFSTNINTLKGIQTLLPMNYCVVYSYLWSVLTFNTISKLQKLNIFVPIRKWIFMSQNIFRENFIKTNNVDAIKKFIISTGYSFLEKIYQNKNLNIENIQNEICRKLTRELKYRLPSFWCETDKHCDDSEKCIIPPKDYKAGVCISKSFISNKLNDPISLAKQEILFLDPTVSKHFYKDKTK